VRKNSDSPSQDSGSGEFRSGPVVGTALVPGVTFARKGLLYADIEGLAIFEGDIVLGSTEDVRAEADKGAGELPQEQDVGITGQLYRWPNATIPYDIDPAMPNQQRVTDAIAHWEAYTPIRFLLRTPANAAQYPDYAHFRSGGGCSSKVGKRGGQQIITLGGICATGNAIHEIGHTVGLWHEQSREDRDTFVRIVWVNIDQSLISNFAQHITDGDDIGSYDYGSIMHYPPDAFSINRQATIIPLLPLPAGVVLGQRNGLSQGDINAVREMYPVTIRDDRINQEDQDEYARASQQAATQSQEVASARETASDAQVSSSDIIRRLVGISGTLQALATRVARLEARSGGQATATSQPSPSSRMRRH